MVISGDVWLPHQDRVTYGKFKLTSKIPHCKFNLLNSSNSTKELRKNSNKLATSFSMLFDSFIHWIYYCLVFSADFPLISCLIEQRWFHVVVTWRMVMFGRWQREKEVFGTEELSSWWKVSMQSKSIKTFICDKFFFGIELIIYMSPWEGDWLYMRIFLVANWTSGYFYFLFLFNQ